MSHLAYQHTTVPSDIGRTSLNNIHIHVGIDISLLMSCSVTLHFVMHPANAMRIQHVSSSPLAQLLWLSAAIPESLRWKRWTVLQIMGLKIRVETKSCLENIKPLNFSVSTTISAFLSLYKAERVHREKWWATTISASPQDLIGGCHC